MSALRTRRLLSVLAALTVLCGPVSLAYSQQVAATLGPYNPNFAVDGLAVDGQVYPDSSVYKSYSCRPSVDFSGFTWCTVHHTKKGKFGRYTSWVTILHSSANKVAFITQAIVPAFFRPGDVDTEIERLSRGFGQAQILNTDPRPSVPHAVLASWGAVTLTPLDDAAMDALRRGEPIHRGLIAEFIGDAHKSAMIGLPVYSIGGGPGYLWGASFDDAGKGSLRISAVDASALGPVQPPPVVARVAPSPSTPSANANCSEITDATQRLTCYDKAAGNANPPAPPVLPQDGDQTLSQNDVPQPPPASEDVVSVEKVEKVYGRYSDLKVITKSDKLNIINIIVNRGNCRGGVLVSDKGLNVKFPYRTEFGETLTEYSLPCNPIEVQLITDHGSPTFTWDQSDLVSIETFVINEAAIYLNITSHVDNLLVNKVVANRGNCKVEYNSKTVMFGQTLIVLTYCNPLEVQVITNQGERTFGRSQ